MVGMPGATYPGTETENTQLHQMRHSRRCLTELQLLTLRGQRASKAECLGVQVPHRYDVSSLVSLLWSQDLWQS